MSSNTPNLDLLKKDPITDGADTFNIETMLNENWDKIDDALGNIDVDIPDASLTQKGIAKLNSAVNSTSETDAATPKAVKTVNDAVSTHVADVDKHVNAAQKQYWDAKETPAGAQMKATQALADAKTYADAKPWQKHKLTQDSGLSIAITGTNLNNLITAGNYVGENMTNAPRAGAGEWFFIRVQAMSTQTWIKQEAINLFTNTYQMRTGSDTSGAPGTITWGAWTDDLFQSGVDAKQKMINALNAMGQPAVIGHSWDDISWLTRQIKTGKPYHVVDVGTVTTTQLNYSYNRVLEIHGVPFQPVTIIVTWDGSGPRVSVATSVTGEFLKTTPNGGLPFLGVGPDVYTDGCVLSAVGDPSSYRSYTNVKCIFIGG